MGMFDGKTVLVTGTSSGIGQALAIALATEGAYVIGAARRVEEGRHTVADIERTGGKGRFIATDIGDVDSIGNLFDTIVRDHGRLDGAVNNAALMGSATLFADLPLGDFDDMLRVNARGTFLCMQHECRIMRDQGKGAIVNVGSIASINGVREMAHYTASKHAILGITRVAAVDMARFGIRVNCLCPGATRTEMMNSWFAQMPDAEARLKAGIPMDRVSGCDEMAATVMWLLSDAASFLTGQPIVVDGGATAQLPQ